MLNTQWTRRGWRAMGGMAVLLSASLFAGFAGCDEKPTELPTAPSTYEPPTSTPAQPDSPAPSDSTETPAPQSLVPSGAETITPTMLREAEAPAPEAVAVTMEPDTMPVVLVKGRPYLTAAGRSPIPMEGERLDGLIPARRLGEDAPRVAAPSGPVPWGAAYNYVGREITVEGTIVDTHNHQGTLCFLNFDKQWQDKFYITVFKSAFEKIPGGIPPEDYFLDKRLHITGKVSVHDGRPNLEVRRLDAIRIIR